MWDIKGQAFLTNEFKKPKNLILDKELSIRDSVPTYKL